MFNFLKNLFKIKPLDESLLARKVDSLPKPVNDQITDAVTQANPAKEINQAVKAAAQKPAVKKPRKKPAAKK